MYRHLLVPTDGSPLSEEAICHAVELARTFGAKIFFLTVTEPFRAFSLHANQLEETAGSYRTHVDERATRILTEAAKVAVALGVDHETIRIEDARPFEAIIRTATQKECDLIAMASHGRRGISALVLGSETVKVLTHSTIPVLVYRSPGENAKTVQRDNSGIESMVEPTAVYRIAW
jgi:nucleotide-binding universal stress UspA family protein